MPLTPRRPSQTAQAIAGRGPQTAKISATKIRAAKVSAANTSAAKTSAAQTAPAKTGAATERTVHFFVNPAASSPRRLFGSLNRDSDPDVEMLDERKMDLDSDVEIIGKGKGKAKQKVKVPVVEEKMPAAEESSDEEVEEVSAPPPPPPKKSKKPAAPVQSVQTEDEDDVQNTVIVSRPAASKPKPRPTSVPTGELHDPPCEQCDKLARPCQKEQSGRACVSCKQNKHKCNYSLRTAVRPVKSKPVVEESEWEDAAGTSSRVSRPAARRAKQAIQDDAATVTKPPRRPRKKSTPAAEGEYWAFLLTRITNADSVLRSR
jgi:hypothetical protein